MQNSLFTVLLLPETKLTGAHCNTLAPALSSAPLSASTYLVKSAIRRAVNDLEYTVLACELCWSSKICQAKASNASAVDDWNNLGPVVGLRGVGGSKERPRSCRVRGEDGHWESLHVDLLAVIGDSDRSTSAWRVWLVLIIKSCSWRPVEREVGRCESRGHKAYDERADHADDALVNLLQV